jgi:hypothetical protein
MSSGETKSPWLPFVLLEDLALNVSVFDQHTFPIISFPCRPVPSFLILVSLDLDSAHH